MDNQKIIQMAVAIRSAVEAVYIKGTENMTQLMGIARTAEAIIEEAGKEAADAIRTDQ